MLNISFRITNSYHNSKHSILYFCFIMQSVFWMGARPELQAGPISTRTLFIMMPCCVSGSCLHQFFFLCIVKFYRFSIEACLCLMLCCPRAWRSLAFSPGFGLRLDWIHLTILHTVDIKFPCPYPNQDIIKIHCRSPNLFFFVSLFGQGTVS